MDGRAIREANAGRSTADVLLAVAFGYFVVCFTLSRLGLRLERRTTRELRAGRGAVRV
jgi:ABC-type amino acid transport system permease subunit